MVEQPDQAGNKRLRGERNVRYITSIERMGIAEGMAKGIATGREEGRVEGESRLLRRLLERRFGALPQWATEQ